MTRLAEAGCRSVSILVPGVVQPVMDLLLSSGFRVRPVPLLYMASAAPGGFRGQVFSPDGVT